jgi:shikimate kinase
MGSGKSTVGRAVAAATGRRYVDNDATIAALAGRSTADLATDGGSALHEWEATYVRRVVEGPQTVVAGIPASCADRDADLALLSASGLLVYLRCSPATLVSRVLSDPPRPWLSDSSEATAALVRGMFDARDSRMRATADLTLDAERSVADIVADLIAFQEAAPGQPTPTP